MTFDFSFVFVILAVGMAGGYIIFMIIRNSCENKRIRELEKVIVDCGKFYFNKCDHVNLVESRIQKQKQKYADECREELEHVRATIERTEHVLQNLKNTRDRLKRRATGK